MRVAKSSLLFVTIEQENYLQYSYRITKNKKSMATGIAQKAAQLYCHCGNLGKMIY